MQGQFPVNGVRQGGCVWVGVCVCVCVCVKSFDAYTECITLNIVPFDCGRLGPGCKDRRGFEARAGHVRASISAINPPPREELPSGRAAPQLRMLHEQPKKTRNDWYRLVDRAEASTWIEGAEWRQKKSKYL